MHIVLAALAAVLRFIWPPHTGQRVRGRAARPRPYVNPAPARPVGPGFDFRPGHGCASVVTPANVNPPANLVRPYYVAWETREAHRRTDRSRLGLSVALDIANTASRVGVSA